MVLFGQKALFSTALLFALLSHSTLANNTRHCDSVIKTHFMFLLTLWWARQHNTIIQQYTRPVILYSEWAPDQVHHYCTICTRTGITYAHTTGL